MIIKLTEPAMLHPVLSIESRWVSAYNPIRIKYQRQDGYYIDVTDTGGFARFTVSYVAAMPSITPMVGDIISISGGSYGTTCIVTAINSVIFIGYSTIAIVTDLPFNGSDTGIINCISERSNWRMEINIKVPDIIGYKTIASNTYRALPDGTIIVEVQEYIKSYFSNSYTYTDSTFNPLDNTSSIQFIVEHRQVFDGYTTENFTEEDPYYAVNAALQYGDSNTPNMIDYVTFDTHNNAKFLCGFKEPTQWLGYPFSVSYIHYEWATSLSLLEAWYDLNLVQVDITNQGLITNIAGHLGMLSPGRGVMTSQHYSYTSLTLCEGVFPYTSATETKKIRVKQPCGKNETMLVWRNTLGGWDYYLFDNHHTTEITVENGVIFEAWTEDISSAEAMPKLLSKSAFETLHLTAGNIDQNDIDGLKGLLQSVAIYSIETAPPYKQTRVIIEPGTWVISESKSPMASIEFTIRKPQQNLQHE